MALFRVLAKMIDDGEHNEDPKTKLVFHLKIDGANRIDLRMESFGYSECWQGESQQYKKYPFVLIDARDREQRCKLSYEGWDADSDDRLNLNSKEIKEGETFTFFECAYDPAPESVYRIVSVTAL